MDGSGAVEDGAHDEDDEEDYEDAGGGSRLLGFMFGNVDCSGDLDVDYLDEDAKEHLSALADKLGSSLTDIDLTKSPSTPTAVSEQDYDEKAEDAVDYEDIEEQYEGPEIQATTEEDYLLPKKEYFSANVSLTYLNQKESIFDEDNYDEDEDIVKEVEPEKNNFEAEMFDSVGDQIIAEKVDLPNSHLLPTAFPDAENELQYTDNSLADVAGVQEDDGPRSGAPLPILCVEDGMVILRFSEIFGIHEPSRKKEKRDHHRYSTKEKWKNLDLTYSIEEDEEAFLKSSCYDPLVIKNLSLAQDNYLRINEGGSEKDTHYGDNKRKDSCFPGEAMKEGISVDVSPSWRSPFCPNFYPLDQQDWEDEIIWGNTPPCRSASAENPSISDSEAEALDNMTKDAGQQLFENMAEAENNGKLSCGSCPVSVEPFASNHITESTEIHALDIVYHPQILRLESNSRNDEKPSSETKSSNGNEALHRGVLMQRFSKISLQNKDLLEGSWLDQIIWDPGQSIPRPRLILDLRDEHMIFELLDNKEFGNLQPHAGAMIMNPSLKSSFNDTWEPSALAITPAGRFNISNDKYYSSRKSCQQLKAHAKKRAVYGTKVLHSVPALRLQTMKSKLSNKEITNFHRPKALWYPRDNKEAAKLKRDMCDEGLIKVVLKTLTGKIILLRVSAEETTSSALLKASKKLDFEASEKVKVVYCGKELEHDKSLASQGVRPYSVLHLVRTKIHLWPRAQKLPSENKPLRPPGAFKKKSELSVKDGHVFLIEYCEERPLILGNIGMGARLCTYYQKSSPGDQTASTLRNSNDGLGNIVSLDPADKTPFLGEIIQGCSQTSIETNMYRAPIFRHELPPTDYLLVRSAKGMLSLRRIDKLYVAGQQEPHVEVMSPGTKNVQNYTWNRLLVYLYREFRSKDRPGFSPSVRADELSSLFPALTETILRKRLKHCAELQKDRKGHFFWVMKHNFRIPSEEELRRMVTPENVCSYESMQAGLHRLKMLGIKNLTLPVGLSAAMNRLPDEAIALAAASHIERELQITPWNLSSNFVACTNQNRENIERLEISGVGDPSGRGLGFSYVRVAPKTLGSSSTVKKKTPAARVGSTVTGTDADLRRLSMDAAREVLLKFSVPEESIVKMTRWHRIAMIRKLSSEHAASGIQVDATSLSKFARGQRMSFVQLQQQTREKCQEIWDRQVQSLSVANGEENESDSEANSDLDSFAGDLENLLDAEEFEGEESNVESRNDKIDGVRGLKMRRCPSQAQLEEEIEEDEAEATAICRLLEGDGSEIKKRKTKIVENQQRLGSQTTELSRKFNYGTSQPMSVPVPDVLFVPHESMNQNIQETEVFLTKKKLLGKAKVKKGVEKTGHAHALVKKHITLTKDGTKFVKEKKPVDKPIRENFVCGACGQLGHMRTNKNCPKYGEEIDSSELENASVKSHVPEAQTQLPIKNPKKLTPKSAIKSTIVEASESSEKLGEKFQAKVHSLKLRCGPPEKNLEKIPPGVQSSIKRIIGIAEAEDKSGGNVKKIIISNKMKSASAQNDAPKPSVVIRLPVETNRVQPPKKIIIKQPKSNAEQAKQVFDSGFDEEFRKTKKIAELAVLDEHKRQQSQWTVGESTKKNTPINRRWLWEEDEKSRKVRIPREKTRTFEEERSLQDEQHNLYELRMHEERRLEMGEQAKLKKKKKKKKKHDFRDEYLEAYRSTKKDRAIPERDRAAKRKHVADLGWQASEYSQPIKRRRGGEVVLSNILEGIVDKLREKTAVSYLFLKPVTKKEAPDYFDVIKRPMDLSTVKDKVRRMEYKNREDFRHDVWQITYNAHMYNDKRNPGIPPLADQLLELCDYLLDFDSVALTEAEAGIEQIDS